MNDSRYHNTIIGMPTEMWVQKMMEYAQLEGLIDPTDFVREATMCVG